MKTTYIKMQKRRITRVYEYLDKVQAAINKYRLAASAHSHGINCKTQDKFIIV
jgi:hypothetical protein